MYRRRHRLLALSLFLVATCGAASAAEFPRPANLKPAVAFWTRVYAEADTAGGFLHDPERLDVVYEQLRVSTDRRLSQREISARAGYWSAVLKRAANGATDPEAQRVRALWGDASPARLRSAAGQVRFQRGQSDKFRAGLVRSGAWEGFIRETFSKRGLPLELTALPHVESSFNPKAGSHAGAAGLWQFMAGTGRRFIRVDHLVDERLDVYRSTEAAAQLLEENYGHLGTWPLALTAYNHGRGGMHKAVRTLGTDDIGRIIAEYKGRAFGFASRNFYPCFLAALALSQDPEPHFGPISRDAPARPRSTSLPRYLRVADLERELGVPRSDLAIANPALDHAIWSGRKLLPAGYILHLPPHAADDAPQRLLALAQRSGQLAQIRDRTHRVAKGESLGIIARRHGTSVAALGKANQLRAPYRLKIGQNLRLPDRGPPEISPAPTQLALAPAAPAELKPGQPAATMPAPTQAVTEASGVLLAAAAPVATGTVVRPALHRVTRGESLGSIAQRHGTTVAALGKANNLRKPYRLKIGQNLRLPAAAAQPAPTQLAAASAARPPAVETPVGIPVAPVTAPKSPPAATPAAAPAAPPAAASGARLAAAGQGKPTAAQSAAVAIQPSAAVLAASMVPKFGAPAPAPAAAALAAAEESDLAIAANGRLKVQPDESLLLYARWTRRTPAQLRAHAGLGRKTQARVGRPLRLDVSRVKAAEVERQRRAWHAAARSAYLERNPVTDTVQHTVRQGDSLWTLCQTRYGVPMWLVRAYNPQLGAEARLKPGAKLVIPRVAARA